ncbi:MAG: hypothetical protein Kow0042_21470 [Calditrichia bacterium]
MKTLRKIVGISLLCGVFALISAQGQQPEAMPEDKPLAQKVDDDFFGPPPMPFLAEQLQLSDEQRDKIGELKLQMEKETLPLRTKMVEYRNELKLLLTSDNPSPSKVNKVLENISKVRQDMMSKHVNHMIQVRSLLSDDQKQKFDMMILSGRKGRCWGPKEKPGPRMEMRKQKGFGRPHK